MRKIEPRASILLYCPVLKRQVQVEGECALMSAPDSQTYFRASNFGLAANIAATGFGNICAAFPAGRTASCSCKFAQARCVDARSAATLRSRWRPSATTTMRER